MELLTILLSSLLTLISPVGLVVDRVVENAFRSRLPKVEALDVRVDNAPSYQVVQGKVERVRIGGRGVWLTPEIRIGVVELETDPINLDLQRLRQGGQSVRGAFREPLQAGVRLVLTEADLNQALQSPAVAARVQFILSRLLGSPDRYQVLNPQIELLGANRIRIQAQVQDGDNPPLAIALETGLAITAGHSLQLIEPTASVGGEPLSPFLVAGFARGLSNRLDLRTLEEAGITARVLELNTSDSELEVAAFVRVEALEIKN